MIFVGPAQTQHIDDLVDLERALFAEDSGRHEPFADVTWPRREGRQDFERVPTEAWYPRTAAKGTSGRNGLRQMPAATTVNPSGPRTHTSR